MITKAWHYLPIRGKLKAVFSDNLIAFKVFISKVLLFIYILENKSSLHLSKFGRARSFHQELTETRQYSPETIYEKLRSIFHICHKSSSE